MRVLIYGFKNSLGRTLLNMLPRYKHVGYAASPIANEVKDHVEMYKPDGIINCYGVEGEDYQMIQANVLFPHLLARQVTDIPIYHISTDRVFAGTKAGKYAIDDKPDSITPFGRTKILGEVHADNVFNVRQSFVVHNTGFAQSVFSPTFVGLKNYRWTGSTVEAIAHAIMIMIAERHTNNVIHLATRESISRYDAAQIILRHAGHEMELAYAHKPVINYSLYPTYIVQTFEHAVKTYWCGVETPPPPVEILS